MLEYLKEGQSISPTRLTEEEKQKRKILGRLCGPCCDIINPTRNGRKYSEKLWDKVFHSPLVQEQFNAGGIFGELTHPDREEVDIEKIAVVMPEPPKKNDKGLLIGYWDILDTPAGRILKTLCDYGYKVGISTRGSGDLVTDYDGQESVDPETYTLNALDIVTIPAVKAARLNMVESLNNKKSLRESLETLVENASEDDKKIMIEAIENLAIAEDDEEENIDATPEKDLHTNDEVDTFAVDSDQALMDELQEALKTNKKLESQVLQLQEKLSVCYAKEANQEEQINKLKFSITKLSEGAVKTNALNQKISQLQSENESLNEQLTNRNSKISSLNERLNINRDSSKELNEQFEAEREKVNILTDKVHSLNESIETLKKDIDQKTNSYSVKLQKSNQLVEKYKNIASKAVNKYIDSQALKLGVTFNEIKNRLPESYTFNDIDSVCEDIRKYKVGISRLPFNQIALNENTQIKIKTENTNSILPQRLNDDTIDEQLRNIAGLK